MLSRDSLEVVFIVIIVSIVLRKAVRDPPGLRLRLRLSLLLLLLMLLVVIVRFRGVIIPRSVSVLRHGAHVGEERLRGAPVLVGQVPQAAGQVRRGRQAVAVPAGHLVGRPLHRRPQEALVAGHHGRLPAGGHGVGRGQGDLGASGNSGSMTDERGHKIWKREENESDCLERCQSRSWW